MEYKNVSPFIDRDEEMSFLENWIKVGPKQILFLYGPKSSGKTTLLYKFIDKYMSDETKYNVKFFNLREILISNYDDFIQTFFQVVGNEEKTDKFSREYNLKIFKLSIENEKKIKSGQLNLFTVMKNRLQELNDNNVQPMIIIDGLQALDFIYFNGQRELVKELINFFVAMTKESHLCHIILSSSDGYFIEKLYNDSKLRKTTKLYEVDYLPKKILFTG